MSRYPWRNTSEDIAKQSNSQWETPEGAQQKADQALEKANVYTDEKTQEFTDHVNNKTIHVMQADKDSWNSKAPGNHTHPNATPTQAGFESPEDKKKLDGIQGNAEVNQNAFSKVNGLSASSKTDALKLVGDVGIVVTENPLDKSIHFTANGDAAPGPHGPTHDIGGSDPIPGLAQAILDTVDAKALAGEALTAAQAAQGTADAAATPEQVQALADEAQQAAESYATEQDTLIGDALNSHIDNSTVGENGVHGLRVNNENLEYYTGSRWMRIINDNPSSQRVFLGVDNINGNDNNAGTTEAPFKTIKRAVKEAVKYYKDIVFIYCATTVNEKIELMGITNLIALYIYGVKRGDSSGLSYPMAKTPQISVLNCTSAIYLSSFEISKELSDYEYGIIKAERSNYVNIGSIRNIIQSGNPAFQVDATTHVDMTNCEVSNRGTAIVAMDSSTVYSSNITGVNNSVGLEASYGARIIKNGTQAGATTATKTSVGGTII